MIELTDQQAEVLETSTSDPPRVTNPRTRETFVLLRVGDYERLAAPAPSARGSVADAFGTAPVLRTRDDILAQTRADRDEWGNT